MRRIKLVLAVAAVMVASLAMVPGPAMAADFDRCRDLRGDFVRCDGELFVEVDEFDSFDEGFFFIGDDDFDFFDDGFFFGGDDFDFFGGDNDFDISFGGDGISQSFEQDSESGDVDQSFDVS
ncbi:MAG: hypothetical protein H0X71_09365 [Rubrobacter sp.]|nr:hypothetical protein [Rubrobacter sp.]